MCARARDVETIPMSGARARWSGDARAGGADGAAAQRAHEPRLETRGAVAEIADVTARIADASGERRDPPALRVTAARERLAERAGAARDARLEIDDPRDHHLRRRRRRRRASVGDETRDREIDLVADRGDDGQSGSDDGARDTLLVERPEVLERAAAAADDQHLERGVGVQVVEGAD